MNNPTISTISGAFQEGDTSWTQCRNKKLDDKAAQSLFNKIDEDSNGELSWEEICNNRDKECKEAKAFITFTHIVTFFNKGSKKQYKENRSKIEEYQSETDSYRKMKDEESQVENM